ncbi:hypothetical protein [Actinomadura napierensis]|uniref:Uncharacterized protein n=1 Tax=Actinomadura napierensis TaxID=267854 RepID=A0ABN2ZZG5_9ACTN
MWLVWVFGVLALLLVFGVVFDWRLRRRGHRLRDGAMLAGEVRENRRDARAWDRGSQGTGGADLFWTDEARRR